MTSPPLEPPRRELRSASSLVLVHTGDGKGKSTAAFGTVLRGIARGWDVAVVQFLKSGAWHPGEQRVCEELGVDWYAAGDGFTWDSEDLDATRAKAEEAWRLAKRLVGEGRHRLVVLDEVSYPITWGWVDVAEVVAVLRERPRPVSVILTGRDMPDEIVAVADTATEMRKIRHAFDAGIRAKRGIDY